MSGGGEGWARTEQSLSFHYFVAGASLCGRWKHPGPYSFSREVVEGECELCTKRLRAILRRPRAR